MEHHINIGESVHLVPTGLDKIHQKIVQGINEKVCNLPPLLPDSCIYRVNEGLRKANPEAYMPMLVSIGPYHHGNPSLQAMEEHKLRYLHSLLERRKDKSVEKYIFPLAKLEDRARKCYADPIHLASDEFLEMMLLDGFFIIEFVRKFVAMELRDRDDPIFNMEWMPYQICRDMILLENQLPLFVLFELYNMTEDLKQNDSFMTSAESIFINMVPKIWSQATFRDRNGTHKIKHLLDFVRILCNPRNECTSSEGSTIDNSDISSQMQSVVELQEAGVKFKKVGDFKGDDFLHNVSLFEIEFNDGLMEIPCFRVDDSTETFFRNLIAYEQHSSDVNPKYFTDYASLMGQLINSEEDAKLLRFRGIIMNMLGDDKEVSNLFNKLGEGVVISSSFYYFGVYNKVNKHCEKTWNVVMSKLRRDYFNNPWASVSTIAAAMLLLFTLIQTIVALITLFA